MGFSINTNYGASIALQQLTRTNKELEEAQQRVNTGLKVGSAKDDGAIFAIAQGARNELAGYGVVKNAMDRAISTVDVAIAGGEAISNLLIDLRTNALAAADASLSAEQRSAYNEEFKNLRDQISATVNNSVFNGVNLLDGSIANITPIANSDGSSTIYIGGQNMSLGGSIVTLGAGQELTSSAHAVAALVAVEASMTNVSTSLSQLSGKAKALEVHSELVTNISDALEAGIGKMVDADLARESARLQALQTKQQLGVEALSIANSASSVILSLFR